MANDSPPDLEVEVQEDVGAGEVLGRYRRFLYGAKLFFTVHLTK